MTKRRQTIANVIDDIDYGIEDADSALLVIGKLDALASAILRDFLHQKPTRPPLLPDVLRRAAKKAKSKADAKHLRKAADLASKLIAVAEEVSYGYLGEDIVDEAEEIRGQLHEALSEWTAAT
jgi:hypothetical protein